MGTNPSLPPSEAGLSAEERQWAMLAHLSVLLNLVTGLGGPIAALLIYLFYRERSRYVAFHALQSLVFQLFAWVAAGVIAGITWALALALTALVVGVCIYPFACLISLIPLGALVYGIIGAIACSRGEDFRYWLIGDWVAASFS
ncbi:DUF4870 domain-containing protein [Thermoflexus sp.]|uniref:DUF4870 domain-containing protein n=1 Tax=Thermoflexus sp. TaxID=1969742 RepID=UPI0025CF4A33|nr:DUF4870 domain-containing protein [Thermoflexus sp.]MDW8179982.1 DUF4870 domain-containing protein [Anaerolineae bacterium]MCS6962547.1 DUF4870 domain-containing protein [Thermoflexus sp.]MCS7350531.1 DUF4870 domain-containing protein [Thermoflexus sp.]MCX7690750.1 DUF4870 domain-containing protein [Thermoflexus sp.]MDW8184671.1 DUF4870 domain-containing protein [Anaerolineae bacterium]